MAYIVETSGNITLVQGDSIEIVINGVPTDQNYEVYFAAQNEERQPIGSEIMVESLGKSSVAIKLLGNYTKQFTVEEDKKSQKYYYGIKLCSRNDETEDTLLLGESLIGELNTITVYPMKVEGI
jgi:hypothetical protein